MNLFSEFQNKIDNRIRIFNKKGKKFSILNVKKEPRRESKQGCCYIIGSFRPVFPNRFCAMPPKPNNIPM